MTIAQGSIIRGVVEMTMPSGGIAQNVFAWKVVGINPILEATTLDALQSWANDAYDNLADEIVAGLTLDSITAHTVVWNETAGEWLTDAYIGWRTLTDSFVNASVMLPPQSAAVVRAITTGVKRKGRKFLPGFGEDTQDGGELEGGPFGALGAFATDWISNIEVLGADQLDPGVLGGATVLGSGDGVFYPFLGAAIVSLLGSQRRRKTGIGE